MAETVIRAGWRDEGLEDAVATVTALPELNAVLERESAFLAQNIFSALKSAAHEDQIGKIINDECKKVLARSMVIGIQGALGTNPPKPETKS